VRCGKTLLTSDFFDGVDFISFSLASCSLRRVHVYNIDDLLACALPSHETRFFARVANLAALKDTRWQFLSRISRTGSPLPRPVLALQCVKDASVLRFVLDLAVGVAQKPHRSTVSFVAATVRDALARVTPDRAEGLLDMVVRAVGEAARSTSADLGALALVLIASLASSALLTS